MATVVTLVPDDVAKKEQLNICLWASTGETHICSEGHMSLHLVSYILQLRNLFGSFSWFLYVLSPSGFSLCPCTFLVLLDGPFVFPAAL